MPNEARVPQKVNLDFTDTKGFNQGPVSGNLTAAIFTYAKFNPDGSQTNQELIIGAGLASMSYSESHNVEQVQSIGHVDFIETITHGVRSRSIRISKMQMIARQLSKIGIVGLGVDNIMGPYLNMIVMSSIMESAPPQTGAGSTGATKTSVEFLKLTGLVSSDYGMSIRPGASNSEDVTFAVNGTEPVRGDYAENLYAILQKRFPRSYQAYGSYTPTSFSN